MVKANELKMAYKIVFVNMLGGGKFHGVFTHPDIASLVAPLCRKGGKNYTPLFAQQRGVGGEWNPIEASFYRSAFISSNRFTLRFELMPDAITAIIITVKNTSPISPNFKATG